MAEGGGKTVTTCHSCIGRLQPKQSNGLQFRRNVQGRKLKCQRESHAFAHRSGTQRAHWPPLRQIFPKYHLTPRRLHPTRRLPPIPQVGKNPHAVHHRALRVLGDHRVHRPVDQQRPRIVLLAEIIALYAIPIRATTSSPESCRPSLQRAGLAVVAFGVVLAFANAHYLHHRGR